jgi:hypothetical protein
MAKTTKDRVPLATYWAKIKAGNPTLNKSPLFKPDIMGPIGKYDQALSNYTKQMLEQDKLRDVVKAIPKIWEADLPKVRALQQERTKLEESTTAGAKTDWEKINALVADEDADVDMMKVAASVASYVADYADKFNNFHSISDKIYSYNMAAVAKLNKMRDDFKSKATTVTSAMSKIDGEVLTLETQIRGIIATYSKIAIDMDHADVVDDIRDLLTHF